MFSGGALERMSILALGIMPYISASIIMQLMSAVSPATGAVEEGRGGGKAQNQPIHALWYCTAGVDPGLGYVG